MDPSHWHELENKYQYGENLDPEARKQWLESLSESHPEIAPTLKQMFAETGEHQQYFEKSPGHSNRPPIEPEPDEDNGFPRVRNHTITRIIGSGGMGVVYLATQESPMRRQVALKIIHSHCASQEYWHRFFAERDVLAKMKHANIANLFDSGFTDDGRPFFSMEYIEGEPITDYCQNHRLKARDRIRLFLQVCQGILHAHQKMVIHRDLKPNNILVVHQDGLPVVKIIDFGISKQLDSEMDKPNVTQIGSYMGTIPYLSPEQASGKDRVTDTRTDLYALGVLLYELLTGLWPFNNQLIRTGYLDQKLRIVREEEPISPSKRLENNPQVCLEMAANMALKPTVLLKTFKGDLDWVLLRAIAKDPDNRYASVIGLIQDLEAFLGHRPVIARPPTLAYQWAKFYQRYRFATWSAVAILLTVVIGLIATLISYRNTVIAQKQALDAKEQQDFAYSYLPTVFTTPVLDKYGPDVTVLEAIEARLPMIDSDFEGKPLAEAFVLTIFALVFNDLSQYERAEELYLEAYEIRSSELGMNHDHTWIAMNNLANTYSQRGKDAEALNLYREAKELQEAATEVGTLTYARSLFGIALKIVDNDAQAAADYFRQVMAIVEKLKATPDGLDIEDQVLGWNSAEQLGILARKRGDSETAVEHIEATYQWMLQNMGEDHSDTLRLKAQWGRTLHEAGRQEGLPILEEAVAEINEKLPPHHQWAILINKNLASFLREKGRVEEAEKNARTTMDRTARYFERTPLALSTAVTLAKIWKQQGCMDEAINLLITQPYTTPAIRDRNSEEEGHLFNNLGDYLAIHGQSDAALWFLEEALEKKLEMKGEKDKSTLVTFLTLTEFYLRVGDFEAGLMFAENSRALALAYLPEDNNFRPFTLGLLGLSQMGLDPETKEGAQNYRQALRELPENGGQYSMLVKLKNRQDQ